MQIPFTAAGADGADTQMHIDRYLPEYDVTTVRHAVVDADPETTYEAMLAADLTDTGPAVRALGRLRDAPAAVSHWISGASRERPPTEIRFADIPDTDEWTELADEPGEEFVFGAVGKFWRPTIEWRRVDAEAFAAFDEPGYAKLAVGLSVRPYGDGRTLLTYEARTATTDDRARRNFRRYWRLIGPFAGYLMSKALERIGTDAAALARRKSRPEPDRDDGDGSIVTARRLLAAVVLAVAGAYHTLIRPWHRRWGATDGETQAPLPGDDLLPDATDQVTHGLEIDAPAEAVWPWLVRLAGGRDAVDGDDPLEAAVAADSRDAYQVAPTASGLEAGDTVDVADDSPLSPAESPEIALLEPGYALVLEPQGESPPWTWAFVLEPVDRETTRLLARTRSDLGRASSESRFSLPTRHEALNYLWWEPVHFVVERGLLREIKRRAEAGAGLESPLAAYR
ncbi:hypothetical protein [Natrinema sp. 1APR25-10V2]|uniref:hypothetical protein n=1 Tax=Natrinema sp. 1APR25-10V2 TaxID=2951081 RepID=UPI002874BE95|nr:hypothetical protein [Natrinema sp. 1APR25-10V2]MDS0476723.1 hypothetical protein [Natrinema sp. 1APR25-10V2]